ncbi:MAG: hypothetical protein HFG05_05110 [Oscillibacter sp.]|nr:hypothetical protein [Oscillibacter sp.]
MPELLFYSGLVLMGMSAAAAVAAAVIFRVSGKRLKARLEAEYGKIHR